MARYPQHYIDSREPHCADHLIVELNDEHEVVVLKTRDGAHYRVRFTDENQLELNCIAPGAMWVHNRAANVVIIKRDR